MASVFEVFGVALLRITVGSSMSMPRIFLQVPRKAQASPDTPIMNTPLPVPTATHSISVRPKEVSSSQASRSSLGS